MEQDTNTFLYLSKIMKQFILLTFVLISATAICQKSPTKGPYDDFMKKFYLKMDTVEWLCEYDKIAWWTSDSVCATPKEERAKLGAEWFCFKKENLWHAVYGKYEDNKFKMVYHYIVDSDNNVSRLKEDVDSMTQNSYARAIVNASLILENYPDSQRVRCNQYVKRNLDKTLSVWLLPAFTTKGIAVYGGEFYYLFDSTGINLISKNEYCIGYRGFKPGPKTEIFLDYFSFEDPPLSAVFFVWYYKDYFDKILINSKHFTSSVIRDNNRYTWIHAAKEK
jgi:hypothetical protein